MSIFSRVKKAKKAADDHKKAVVQNTEAPEPPPAPYKHVPTHAAQVGLAITPTRWSPEEARARINIARKRMSVKVASAPLTRNHSRASNNFNFSSPHTIRRPHGDVSIDSILNSSPSQSYHSRSSGTSTLPPLPHTRHTIRTSEDYHAFSKPREPPPPPPPPIPRQFLPPPSSKPSVLKKKSPLSTVATDEEADFSHGSGVSSTSSVSSKHSSTDGNRRRSTNSSHGTSRLPMPKFLTQKQAATIEISLPYGSTEDLTPVSRIPTWRYEDFTTLTEPPVLVENVTRSHSITSSYARSIHHRKQGSITAF